MLWLGLIPVLITRSQVAAETGPLHPYFDFPGGSLTFDYNSYCKTRTRKTAVDSHLL